MDGGQGGRGADLMYEIGLGASLSISFQRYPYPPQEVVTSLQTSWGALPFVVSAPQRIVLPGLEGEAFWIGLVSPPGARRFPPRVTVFVADGRSMDALVRSEGKGAPRDVVDDDPDAIRYGIPGIAKGEHTWWPFAYDPGAFGAPAVRRVEMRSMEPGSDGGAATLEVDVVKFDRFQMLGGDSPRPLDSADLYGGWLLP